MEKVRIKITQGNKKDCIKKWPRSKAEDAVENGTAIILDEYTPKDTIVTRPLEGSHDDTTCQGTRTDGEPCNSPVTAPDTHCRYHIE